MSDSLEQMQVEKPANEDPVFPALEVSKKIASAHKQFEKTRHNDTPKRSRAKALDMLEAIIEGIGHHEGEISSSD